jgi:hypothetical protein
MVIRFPTTARGERERTFDVAAKAIPLLEAALDAGNAALVREIFAVLGDVAGGADASGRLADITIEDAQIVRITSARCRTS